MMASDRVISAMRMSVWSGRLLAAVLVASSAPAADAQGSRQAVDLRIIATTDLHGRVRAWDYFGDSTESARGLSRVATIVDSIRADTPGGTILVDAGDFLQGNALTYVAARPGYAGVNPVVAAMNTLQYDAVVLGNHEFNYGLPFLDRAMASARFSVLAANVRRRDGGRRYAPFVMLKRRGVKIAVVGLTNPWAMVWDRDLLRGKIDIEDLVVTAKSSVAKARGEGADVVIVVTHSGFRGAGDTDLPGVPAENATDAIAREVPGIDAIVFGHTHREIADTTIHGVLLTQPRNWATSASVIAMRIAPDGNRWTVVSKRASTVRAAGHAEQAVVVRGSEAAHAAARRYATTVVGQTPVAWSTDSARTADAPVIDFIGETMRRATGADLASTAVFSTRIRLAPGPVTVANLAQLYPYDNTIRVLRLTGAQLKAFLEQSARYYRVIDGRAAPDPAFIGFNFEAVTGASYTFDISRPPGDRVLGLSVRGRAVQAADSFSVALSNYRASGAGGYGMLAGAPVVKDDPREVRQLLIDEITRRRALKPEDFFVASWKLEPAPLAAQVQAALSRESDFEAVRPATRPPPLTPPQGGRATTLRLISISDFHGALEARPDGNAGMRGGAAHVAATVRRLERDCTGNCTSVFVDGGDQFQGTPASNLAYGRPVVAVLNAMGLAAAALGNHDLDWGQDTLRARMREARYGMFAANVTDSLGRPVSWIRPDTMVERGGLRIGIVGLATVTTPTVTQARNTVNLRFVRSGPVVIERARQLRARGADLVIVVAHAGANCNDDACTGEMVELAQEAQGSVDAIVGGHNHAEFSTVVAGIPIVRSRSSGRAVRYVDLPVDRSARTALDSRLVYVNSDSITPDPEVWRVASTALASVQAIVDRPIVSVAETMARGGPQYALGNLIADAQRAAISADVAVMNNGGIRANLRAGPATYGAFFEISPFANLLMRMTVTGADLRAYFERVVGGPGVRAHVSGARVRYDPARPAGQRIVELTVGGRPVEATRTYTIAMSDFMATGGDGLALTGPAQRTESLGIVDLDALIAFVQQMPGGVIRPDAVPRIAPVP
jgi:2',3'-cyclic-nucleotide 2'-phosphodiesterase/3'-nucleotidase/5'-nucleotidase